MAIKKKGELIFKLIKKSLIRYGLIFYLFTLILIPYYLISMRSKINIYERLDYLIFSNSTGTRKQLADKFGVSERTISRYLEVMNENGATIHYNRSKRSFCYQKSGRFIVSLEFKPSL